MVNKRHPMLNASIKFKAIDCDNPEVKASRRKKSKVSPNRMMDQMEDREWLWLYKTVCLKAIDGM
jgi:hypothetical protein